MENIRENYKTLLNLGFLDQRVIHSNTGKILNVPQAVSRPGRPVLIPLTYEDMLTVDEWDDSKLVFKKVNMQGMEHLGSMLAGNMDDQVGQGDAMNLGANQSLLG
jgi:hypothetical protein